MLELNKVMLIGNLTRDPELSYLPSGSALAKMSIAVNRSWKDKSGQWQREAAFFDLDAWQQSAEFAGKYLKKGRRVYVEGSLRQNTWEAQDGTKRSQVRITVERIQFADEGKAQQQDGEQGAAQEQPAASPPPRSAPTQMPPQDQQPGTADDLPF